MQGGVDPGNLGFRPRDMGVLGTILIWRWDLILPECGGTDSSWWASILPG